MICQGFSQLQCHVSIAMIEKKCKNIVLCFDGTRENFGPQPITNVLKLYQMLDNNDDRAQMCYYQPGVGTEADFDPVTDVRRKFTSSHFSNITDAMFASSVDHHIVAGYLFLMEHFEPGDQIYMFGFSRGAFIARALAGMIELVGLLNRGLTGMVSMAWRIYEKWEFAEQPAQPNYNSTLAEEFRRTFSRGCEIRVHFQGLWDSVNSVGILRDRLFPCTQRSGIVDHVRHAVSLDERKGKFKQQSFAPSPNHIKDHFCAYGSLDGSQSSHSTIDCSPPSGGASASEFAVAKFNSENPSNVILASTFAHQGDTGTSVKQKSKLLEDFAPGPYDSGQASKDKAKSTSGNEIKSISGSPAVTPDLIEKWFPGDHSDVGGGWSADCATRENLSNLSMRWMIAEAFKHGVKFKPDSIHEFASKHTTIGSLFSSIHDKLSFNHGIMLGPLDDEITEACWNRTSDADSSLVTPSVTVSWFTKVLTDLRDYRRAEKLSDEEVARETYSSHCSRTSMFETFLWWILEFIPIGLRVENEAGKWRNAYIPNLDRHRYVPLDCDMHWSIFWRIKYDKRYRPTNLPTFARDLLEEFENIHVSSPTVANINTIASPLKTYPHSLEQNSVPEEHNDDALSAMQSLLRKEDLERIAVERTATKNYFKMKKAFHHWSLSSWREFPDDLKDILNENPSL